MKICFWSHVRNKAGVTTNMACVSTFLAIGQGKKSFLLENHYSLRSLGDVLMEPEAIEDLREHGNYYSKYGIEYILKRMYSGESPDKLIKQTALSLLFSSLYYLPQGRIVNKEVFNYEFHQVHERLFDALERKSDYVFIDTESNQNLSTSTILSSADLIVVNLTQNPEQLEAFFTNDSSIQEKAVYLIGNYSPELPWNVGYICKKYDIPRNKIGVIPANQELKSAIDTGSLLPFLNRNYSYTDNEETEYMIRYGKRAARMIQKEAQKRKEARKNRYVAGAEEIDIPV